MRTAKSCGPDAVGFVFKKFFNKTQEEVDKAFGINDINNFKNFGDTPWNHFSACWKLHQPILPISSSKIIRRQAENEKTIILFHYLCEEPELRNLYTSIYGEIFKNLYEHWIILHSVTDTHLIIHWGDGQIHYISHELFEKSFNAGLVRCAYVIGKGKMYLPFWVRWYANLTGRFY